MCLAHVRFSLGKGKKLSVDFSPLGKAFVPESPRGPSEKPSQSSIVPSVVVSRLAIFLASGSWNSLFILFQGPRRRRRPLEQRSTVTSVFVYIIDSFRPGS